MKGFYIQIKNGLLDPKHIKAMQGDKGVGTVWLFLWLIDKMTIIDHEKGEGKVWGGKPIKYEDIKNDLGISRATYKRWVDILRKAGYIKTTRTPHGLSITVYKAFKVFNQQAKRDGSPKSHHTKSQEPSQASKNKSHEPSNIRQDTLERQDTKTLACRKEKFTEQDMRLAELMWREVNSRYPTEKKPNLNKWADHIRLTREQDGRTYEQIIYLIKWSQQNTFWQANIRSTQKLREKFDTLVAHAKREHKSSRVVQSL